MPVEKFAQDVARAGTSAVRESVQLVKKAWSIMDAATQKTRPTEFLTEEAVKSIKGGMPGQ